MRKEVWLALVLVAVLVGSLGPAAPIYACSPEPGWRPPTVAEHTIAAGIVLVGTVTSAAPLHAPTYSATVEVHEYIKGGSEQPIVQIDGFGSSAACLVEVRTGQHWIFFATKGTDGTLKAHYLGPHTAIAEATDTNIAAARAVAWIAARIWMPVLHSD